MKDRYCPICERTTSALLCPTDGVNTIVKTVEAGQTNTFQPGQSIAQGRYRIERKLGEGAMGVVYSATQVAIRRTVAIKVLQHGSFADQGNLKRFYREAQLASRLRHPNVVDVYDFGVEETSGAPYIVMQFVDGCSLGHIIKTEAPLDQTRAATLLEQVVRALISAHEAGLVHRDLKPDNVMVTVMPDGLEHCTVLDFGIAKSIAGRTTSPHLTTTGVVVGTPRYMSPEQIENQPLDGRSDLYSVGCILHEMLSGAPPFSSDSLLGLMTAHLHAARPAYPPPGAGAPADPTLVELHRRLMMVDPNDRPDDAAIVATALRHVARGAGDGEVSLAPRARPSRPIGWRLPAIATAVVVVTGLATAGLMQSTRPSAEPAPATVTAPPHRAAAPERSSETADAEPSAAAVPAAARRAEPPATSGRAESTDPTLDAQGTVVETDTTGARPRPLARPRTDPRPPRWVTVDSEPPGATVLVGGRRVGTTPHRVRVPRAGVQVRLRADGYDTKTLRLTQKHAGRRVIVLKPSIIPEL